MSASDPRRLVVTAPGAKCPMCGEAGDPTALFKHVYLCVTPGCRVWTFEGEPEQAPPVRAEPRREPADGP